MMSEDQAYDAGRQDGLKDAARICEEFGNMLPDIPERAKAQQALNIAAQLIRLLDTE